MWTLLRRWWFIWRYYTQLYHTAIITIALVYLRSSRCDLTSPSLYLVFAGNRSLLESSMLTDSTSYSYIFYCLRFETSLFVASYDSQGHGGGIRPRLHTGVLLQSSQSYVTTDGQPASLSWNKAPIWGLRHHLDYCLTFAGFLNWCALSDERTGLPIAIATGLRQCSQFRVRVP
jgi:hypothetical protein